MFFPSLNMPQNQRNSITTFLGYNHNVFTQVGESYDMKNMSSDYYPYIGTRDRRKCMLSINKLPYITVEPQIETSYDAQVSEVTLYYRAESLDVGEKETIVVRFNADDTLIDEWEVRAIFTLDDGTIIIDTAFDTEEARFVTTERTVSAAVLIKANVIDVENFNESVVEAAVTDYSCDILNRNIRGMLLKDGKLAYMVASTLYYGEKEYDFKDYMPEGDDYRKEVQLISYGLYLLIFPLGLYLKIDNEEHGRLGEKVSFGTGCSVTYTMSTEEGGTITASSEKPQDPVNGEYWCDTENKALYQWYDALGMWQSVSATYIKIEVDGDVGDFPNQFNVGGAVFMNTKLSDVNEGSIIQSMGDIESDGVKTGGYIVVKGYYYGSETETLNDEAPLTFERKIPKLDYVCVSNNRLWGCFHGYDDDGKFLNEIHASALGDAKNWFTFAGTATDSYTVNVGSDGDFTGICTYQGYPVVFKEDVIYRIYGAYPAQYQMSTYECRGVQKGSHKSISICDEYLIYKSINDVCIFDGGNPTGISAALGTEKYFEGAAGSCLGKYYLSVKDEAGDRLLFTYDIKRNLWMKEDKLDINEFSYNESGELYGRSETTVYGFGRASDSLELTNKAYEKQVKWSLTSGELGLDYYAMKYIKHITVRAQVEYGGELDVSISLDGGEYRTLRTVKGRGTVETHHIPVNRLRCDSFRIKLEGRGKAVIYNMAWDIEEGEIKR